MSYIYKTKGTCSTQIEVELDGNIVKNVKFTGGCQGNLQAIPRLVEGMTVEGLSHNTVRGAAGGAVLCAELLKAQGYITKK